MSPQLVANIHTTLESNYHSLYFGQGISQIIKIKWDDCQVIGLGLGAGMESQSKENHDTWEKS